MKNKKFKQVLSILIFSIFAFIAISSLESNSSSSNVDTSVENVRIDKSISNAWGVKGQIRNNSDKEIKGAVKIKFINSNGDIVHNGRAFVNGGDYFNSGQSASFEYFVEPEKFTGVVDFEVIFYER